MNEGNKYNPEQIELKWQTIWEKSEDLYRARDFDKKPKFYMLFEFPYPSGDGLHMGHLRGQTIADIIARKKRLEGYNVMLPIGWDAFGLPTENYAIKHKIHPSIATKNNIKNFIAQEKRLGYSFDWSREINTTDSNYYKWTQWLFLKFYEHGLAYKKKMPINWCPSCKIGLANEEVIDNKCERCGAEASKRELEQWMLRITKYADKLLDGLKNVDYPEMVKNMQINWIGKSEGINFTHKVKDLDIEFEVYDSIPQTFMAQTFVIIAPEHPMVERLVKGTEKEREVMEFVEKIKRKKITGKFDIEKDMEGIFTGRYSENYLGIGRDLPIWVASFALVDYGTGIVGCSAHDERDFAFAKKNDIPLHPVLFPEDPKHAEQVKSLEVFYREPDGILQEPKEFVGMRWDKARQLIIDYIEKNGFGKKTVNYKMRDWIFSRQHYWGEPIPIINCEKCGLVPVPEDQLPVKLPEVENYEPTDTGESPLSAITDWVNTTCPKCGGPAKRETDTMPNWAGSSWYFLRYIDPKNNKAFADFEKLKYWMPVDIYEGGMEHTTLHLLYSRFWNEFFYDIGLVPVSEPYNKRIAHGIILAEDGRKMSKSFGNVINPDNLIAKYGADILRAYEVFIGPFDQQVAWNSKGIEGVSKFLNKVWNLGQEIIERTENVDPQKLLTESFEIGETELEVMTHKTIKKFNDALESFRYNTLVSTLMEFTNYLQTKKDLLCTYPQPYLVLILLLSPIAPHIAEEVWQQFKFKESIFSGKFSWPIADPAKTKDELMTIIIQINGKVRDQIVVPRAMREDEVKAEVLKSQKTLGHVAGKDIKKTIYVPEKLINIVI